jgi:hypothetical protein
MRFSCGQSHYEKNLAKQKWHAWFAWRPVRVASGDCRWLETVARKGRYHYGMIVYSPWDWKYAALPLLPQSQADVRE